LLTVAEVLTDGAAALPPPMEAREFYACYRERLEYKLRHKLAQIQRTERLLENLPLEQKPAFESLLAEARQHRLEIQTELDQLHRLLSQHTSS
jgi:hypothetical protein